MSKRLVVNFVVSGKPIYQDTSNFRFGDAEEVLEIYINRFQDGSDQSVIRDLKRASERPEMGWLSWNGNKVSFDPVKFRELVSGFDLPDWIDRSLVVNPEIFRRERKVFERTEREAYVFIRIGLSDIMSQSDLIFLSHKSSDKPFVRSIFSALEAIHLAPWLDEIDVHVGANLDRDILAAFERSAAVVFFVTNSFADDGYIGTEIDYAVRRKRQRGSDFSIITLRIVEDGRPLPDVPALLKTYVWKDVKAEIDAFTEIAKALPHYLFNRK